MQKSSQLMSRRSRRRAKSKVHEVSPTLLALRSQFEVFREEHARGTRVPMELRSAVLAAVRQGVKPNDLHRVCGVSKSQIMTWQSMRRGRGRKRRRPEPSDVRVLEVVEAPAANPRRTLASAAERDLELRLGPWLVSVRLAELATSERGVS